VKLAQISLISVLVFTFLSLGSDKVSKHAVPSSLPTFGY